MNKDKLVLWAKSKNCGPRRTKGTCEDAACEENDRNISILESMERFDGADSKGVKVRGWLIRD